MAARPPLIVVLPALPAPSSGVRKPASSALAGAEAIKCKVNGIAVPKGEGAAGGCNIEDVSGFREIILGRKGTGGSRETRWKTLH
jgi:hypothetical protein